ncbi:MAG: hypothetical protein M1829_004016 [Trizodia sp. TS-e1964]|nr:MAG: hypothetical protein M1829_004016 [Trizodia sp. TS-e1964]
MGGRYWYYYQLDGEIETYNTTQPSTSACPLLPGQPVNILDVPFEMRSSQGRGRSESADAISTCEMACTMNPDDKYLTPRPAPTPSILRLATSPAVLHPVQSRSNLSSSPSTSSPSAGASASSTSSNSFALRFPFSRKRAESDSSRTKTDSTLRAGSRRGVFSFRRSHSSEDTRGRGDSGADHPMEISDPVLVSRSDPGRHCIALSEYNSAASSREPSPFCDNLSTRSRDHSPRRPFVEALPRDPSPVRSIRSSRAREPSPLGYQTDGRSRNHSVDEPNRRSRGPSPLRISIAREESAANSVVIPEDITEEVEDVEEDDYNFQAEPFGLVLDDSCSFVSGLKAPPSRMGLPPPVPEKDTPPEVAEPELVISDENGSAVEEEEVFSFTQDSSYLLPPSPIGTDALQSHFSMDSSTTAAFSPVTLPSEPSTPSFSEDSEFDFSSSSSTGNLKLDLSFSPSLGCVLINEESMMDSSIFTTGFQGYSLPIDEPLESTVGKKALHASPVFVSSTSRATFGNQDVSYFTKSWQRNIESERSPISDLIDDLGYLGGMIVPK